MPYPTPVIEIAFDDGPYVVSPTWTDVTSYVREFSTSRGVPDDWTYQADGSATVTLSNRDRRFDPFYTSGPYYGKLLPRRQIRITATAGGSATNAVTNPSLTTDATNWSGNGSTVSRITSDFYTAPASLQAVATTTVNARAINGATTRIPVTAGVPHTVSVWIKCPSVGGNFRFWVNQWAASSGGSPVTTLFSLLQTVPVGTWTQMVYQFTPTQPFVNIEIALAAASIGQIFYVDNLSVAATVYDVFRGFVSGWPPEWTDAGYDSTVTLSCFDALQLLGSSSLPADWSRDYILSQSPRHYYPCDEPIIPYGGTTTLRDLGSIPLTITASATAVNTGQLATGLPGNAIAATETSAGSSTYGTTATSTDFSVSMWAIMDSVTATTGGTVGSYGWATGWNPDNGKYVVTIQDQPAGLTRTFTSTQTFDGSQPTHVAFSFNVTSKALVLYVDGVVAATTSATAGAIIVIVGENVVLGTGAYQQVCVWTGILAQATIQTIINYSKAVFSETTTARFNRIIAETPFSATLTSAPASPASAVLDITDDAPTSASELVKVSNSEYAPLFVNKAGTLTLYSQGQIRSQSSSIVSQVTYGNGGVPIGPDVQLQYDGDSMRNVGNIQMSGGGVYIQTNSSSVTTYAEAEQFIDTQVSTLADAQDIANIVTGWGGQVYAKASPVSVVLSPTGSWGSTLALELFDRFTLAVAPKTGNVITTPMLLSRVSHSATPERWVTTVEGSARWAAVFIVGQSTIGGTNLLA